MSLMELYNMARCFDGTFPSLIQEEGELLRKGHSKDNILKYFGKNKPLEVIQSFSEGVNVGGTMKEVDDMQAESTIQGEECISIVPEKEKFLAKKLQDCCDAYGKERKDNLFESAGVLLEMGKLYLKYAITTTGIQQKQNFVKAAALVNASAVRFKILGKKENMEFGHTVLRSVHEKMLEAAGIQGGYIDIIDFSKDVKDMLTALRILEAEKLDRIPNITDTDSDSVACRKERQIIDQVRRICEENTENFISIMSSVTSGCQSILGEPPCRYVIVGLGSTARKEVTLYSDFEHVIILEDNIQNYASVREYFLWFSVFFHVVIIGLGETIIPAIDVKSLCDFYSDDKSKRWFSDEYTPCGVSFDGMIPHACKLPMGRQQATKYRKNTVELIRPVSLMAKLITNDEEIKNGYFLKDVLSHTCFVSGDHEIYQEFLCKSQEIMDAEKTDDVAKEQLKKILHNPNQKVKDGVPLFHVENRKFKHDTYRPMSTYLACISRLCDLKRISSFEIVDAMERTGVVDAESSHTLNYAVAVALEGRMKMYRLAGHQRKNLTYTDWAALVGERSAIDCQLTIDLLRPLVKAMASNNRRKLVLMSRDSGLWHQLRMEMTLLLEKFEETAKICFEKICLSLQKYEMSEIDAVEAAFRLRQIFPTLLHCFLSLDTVELGGRQRRFASHVQNKYTMPCEWVCKKILILKDTGSWVKVKVHQSLCMVYHDQKRYKKGLREFDQWFQIYCSSGQSWILEMDMWVVEIELRLHGMDGNELRNFIEKTLKDGTVLEREYILKVGLCQVLLKLGFKSEAQDRLYLTMIDIKKDVRRLGKYVFQILMMRIRGIQWKSRFFSHMRYATKLLSSTVEDDFTEDIKWMSKKEREGEKHVGPSFDTEDHNDALTRSLEIFTSFSYGELIDAVNIVINICQKQRWQRGFLISYVFSLMAFFENVKQDHRELASCLYWEAPDVVKRSPILQPFLYGYMADAEHFENTQSMMRNQSRILKTLFKCNTGTANCQLFLHALLKFTELEFENCLVLLWKMMHWQKTNQMHQNCTDLFLTSIVTVMVLRKRKHPAKYFSKTREISSRQVLWTMSCMSEGDDMTALNSNHSKQFLYQDDPLVPVYNLALTCRPTHPKKCMILLWKVCHFSKCSDRIEKEAMKLFISTAEVIIPRRI